jgi:hypothetical protein
VAIDIPAPVVLSGSAAPIGLVPPGACTVAISCTGTGPAYIGTNAAVTSSDGFPLPTGQTITLTGYPSSAGTQLYATATSATVGVIISNAR